MAGTSDRYTLAMASGDYEKALRSVNHAYAMLGHAIDAHVDEAASGWSDKYEGHIEQYAAYFGIDEGKLEDDATDARLLGYGAN